MAQQQRRRADRQTQSPAPPSPQGTTAVDPATQGRVRLIAGADVQDLTLGGRTVAETRRVAQAVFGIHPDARALVDGREVGEAHVLESGARLEFTRRAGQKGAAAAFVQLAGDRATWQGRGSANGGMPLRILIDRVRDAGEAPERWRLYPQHVRLMAERRKGQVIGVVIEMPPGPRCVSWIASDSPATFGPTCRFEERELSFPWVILLAVFSHGELTGLTQAFYRTQPLTSLDDRLLFTNLLNVAPSRHQESWICFQNIHRSLGRLTWDERIAELCRHFWQAAFTRHANQSFFETGVLVDSRLATAATWEAATRRQPYFALELIWSPAPDSVGVTLARMLDQVAPWQPIERAEQLVTLMQPED